MTEYDPAHDGIKSYYAAIEAKRLRGDTYYPTRTDLDRIADCHVGELRRAADDMADALDRAAMRDVEGAREWRDLTKGNRYADR